MKFQDTVKKSIKAFTEGKMPKNLMQIKEEEGILFTPDYFDELEDSLIGQKGSSKKSKAKEETVDEA